MVFDINTCIIMSEDVAREWLEKSNADRANHGKSQLLEMPPAWFGIPIVITGHMSLKPSG